ncbi:histone-lysine N-methyltransferase SUVR4-like [Hordeum vulgare subsp. vulgare]|uniref:Histone-lysine N-methyltransferase n=1 Tax=Hordeum vulgare subsp. vulgare TaxID=112509 RepID=A0A287JCV9_HORVV|nr:histone-lysine N-methyltransferase SUVR4-like [Hordeum vulgare subsp. vulgare]
MGSSRGNRNSRARRAVKAMKLLGISREQTTPVLKRLVELYDDNWQLIEAESYRVLADAIFDEQANGGPDNGGDQAQGQGELDLELEETSTMPEMFTPEDDDQRPSTSLAVVRKDPDYHIGAPRSRAARSRANPLGPNPARASSPPHTRALSKQMQMMDEDFQQPVFLREPKPEPVDMDAVHCLNVQPGLIHRSRKRSAPSSEFLALPPPEQTPKQISEGDKNRTIQHCRNREMPTLSVEPANSTMNNGMGSGVGNMQEVPCLDVDLASSPRGDVKMSLKFSVDPSKFHMPDLEAVFKMVEKKCLHSSDFSIHGILTEMCQCVVQLGTEHTVEHNTQSDIVGNGSLSENGINRKQKAREEPLVLKGLESGPANSTLAQQHHLALSISRIIHDVTDISKGEENLRISIIDESGREKCPPSFYYMPTNAVFQNALVSISLAKIGAEDCCSECFGNCLRAPAPCACARETGGDYAYTLDGLVKPAFIDECVSMNRFPEEHHRVFCKTCPLERSRNQASPEPCRGHLVRKFIKECWSKCGCNMQCGNRVVQRGIKCNLQVFFTEEGRAWGLRTLDDLPKGTFICEYAGEILTNAELHERAIQNMQNARYTRPILLDAGWRSGGAPKDEEALCLDGTFYGNVGRFINHRCCDANLAMIPVEVEAPDHQYYHVAFFTSKKVEAFEELTWDYGIDFDDERWPVKAFECLCGSRYCRGGRRHLLRKERRSRATAR